MINKGHKLIVTLVIILVLAVRCIPQPLQLIHSKITSSSSSWLLAELPLFMIRFVELVLVEGAALIAWA
jgi:hypothetical protein